MMAAVYRAFLESYLGHGGHANVSSKTMSADISAGDVAQCMPNVRIQGLDGLHTGGRDLGESLGGMSRVRLVDASAQEAEIERNDPSRPIAPGSSSGSVDDAVSRAFASGLLSLSDIAFDQEHRHAVLQMTFECGQTCGQSMVVALEKSSAGKWRVSNRQCGGGWLS